MPERETGPTMQDRKRGYAEAIVAIAKAEDALDAVEDELLDLARAIESRNELRERLTDIHLPAERRLSFVRAEVLEAAHPATRSALALLITAERVRDIQAIAREVAERAAAEREAELAEVYVAVELDPERRERLRQALERVTGKRLTLKVVVDSTVMGGVRARVGDTVLDGSVARRLADVQARLGS